MLEDLADAMSQRTSSLVREAREVMLMAREVAPLRETALTKARNKLLLLYCLTHSLLFC